MTNEYGRLNRHLTYGNAPSLDGRSDRAVRVRTASCVLYAAIRLRMVPVKLTSRPTSKSGYITRRSPPLFTAAEAKPMRLDNACRLRALDEQLNHRNNRVRRVFLTKVARPWELDNRTIRPDALKVSDLKIRRNTFILHPDREHCRLRP
jgi:hypothetical protein